RATATMLERQIPSLPNRVTNGAGPERCFARAPGSTGHRSCSAQRHFGHEQVVAARPAAVGVEEHHLAVRARHPHRQGEADQRTLETVVVHEQPLIAAGAALAPDVLVPEERALPWG